MIQTSKGGGPSWANATMRETFDLDTGELIRLEDVTDDNRGIYRLRNKRLPKGPRSIMTVLHYVEYELEHKEVEHVNTDDVAHTQGYGLAE